MKKELYIGADHNGFRLKEHMKKFLSKKYNVIDKGNLKLQPKDDYPDYGIKVARAVSKTKTFGILICGSSQGVCIVANKVRGIRAVSVFSAAQAKQTREHNDANVICLSGWDLSKKKAETIINTFLKAKFSNAPRHRRRVKKILALDK